MSKSEFVTGKFRMRPNFFLPRKRMKHFQVFRIIKLHKEIQIVPVFRKNTEIAEIGKYLNVINPRGWMKWLLGIYVGYRPVRCTRVFWRNNPVSK
jgi:hypothetical protein